MSGPRLVSLTFAGLVIVALVVVALQPRPERTTTVPDPGPELAVIEATGVAWITRTALRKAWAYPDDPIPATWLEQQGCRWRAEGDTVEVLGRPSSDGQMVRVEEFGWTSAIGVRGLR